MKFNQKGFSIVEILIVIVVVGLIGTVGRLVYNRQYSQKYQRNSTTTNDNSNVTNPTESAPADNYTDWATYNDEYVSFRYPKDWTVSKQYTFADPYGALNINIKAPVDNSLTPADTNNKNLYLASSVLIAKDGRFTGNCTGCGQVFSVESIETADKGKGSLIIADSGVPGEPAIIDLVSGQVAVGDKDYTPSGIRVGSNYSVRISGSYVSGDLSLVGFKTVNGIKDSQQYSLLRDLVKTIQVQASNLP